MDSTWTAGVPAFRSSGPFARIALGFLTLLYSETLKKELSGFWKHSADIIYNVHEQH